MRFFVCIGGVREFNDYDFAKQKIDICLSRLSKCGEITIVTGHCKGTDMLAECYAFERGYSLEVYPADWEKYGRSAGPRRNKQMVEISDYVICFWNGKSKGTKSLIDFTKKANKPLRIIYYDMW